MSATVDELRLLPEPTSPGRYDWPEDGSIVVMLWHYNRPGRKLWVAFGPIGSNDTADKKRQHDTPEAAAAWLASRGYGPGANRGEGEG